MSRGRRTKGGLHYSEEERRRLAQLSVTRGTAAVARENGISEASIKAWRKAFGVQGNDDPWGGTMDRHYCRRCVHGCAQQGSFTGCTHLLDTGEKRPYTPDGWCLGFEPRQGVHQSTVDAYRRMCARHVRKSDNGDNDNDEDGMDMNAKRLTEEQQKEIHAFYMEHSYNETLEHFHINSGSLSNITKKYGKKSAMPVYKKLTAEDIPEVAAAELPDTDVGDISAEPVTNSVMQSFESTEDEMIAGRLQVLIRGLEERADKYRRMLAILEEEA